MNVIFDLDGTIVDSVPGISASLIYAIRQQGHIVNDDINITSLVGPSMEQIVRKLLAPYHDNRIEETLKIYREHYGSVGLEKCTMYDGVYSLLSSLKDDMHDLFIATSKRNAFAEKIITNMQITNFFSGIIGTPTDGSLDDKRYLLSHLISRYSLSSRHTLMVGDRREDVISAKYNNIKSIGVLWGYGTLFELSGCHVDYTCENPSNVFDTIRKYSAGYCEGS